MKKLSTERINSFPSTKRASVNKLMTENSVTRLINRLIDVDGFVITTGLTGANFVNDLAVDTWLNIPTSDFEFVIRGYYFSIASDGSSSGLQYLLSATTFNPSDEQEHTLYAGIFIDKTDNNFPELYGQDDEDGEYQAIVFYTDDEVPEPPIDKCSFYSLPLVKYMQQENGSWGKFIPLTSLFKFSSTSISNIDGGEIDLHR